MTDAELLALCEETRRNLRREGKWVSADGRIYPEEAADLLGRKLGTLANWRSDTNHPLRYVAGARVTYFIIDVLRFAYSGCAQAA